MEPLRTRTRLARHLLWKEWREQRWKLGFGCLLLAAFAVIGLRTRAVADEAVLTGVCLVGVLLLPVLAVTGLVPAERADGSLAALLSLPVPAWQVLVAKTAAGAALCAGPLAAAAAVGIAMAAGREMSAGAMIGLFARSAAAALSLFFWMFALTVRLPTEARAGLVSLGVLVGWLITVLTLQYHGPADVTEGAFAVVSPFVFTYRFDPNSPMRLAGAVAAQATIAAALWVWAATRFARSAEDRS